MSSMKTRKIEDEGVGKNIFDHIIKFKIPMCYTIGDVKSDIHIIHICSSGELGLKYNFGIVHIF